MLRISFNQVTTFVANVIKSISPTPTRISSIKSQEFFAKTMHPEIGIVHDGDSKAVLQEASDMRSGSKQYSKIREGLADILIPSSSIKRRDAKSSEPSDQTGQTVFYNPIQQFNRDLSVVAIKVYGDDLLAARRIQAQSKTSRGKKRKRKAQENDIPTDKSSETPMEVVEAVEGSDVLKSSEIDTAPVLEHKSETFKEPESSLVSQQEAEDGQGQFQKLRDSLPTWKTKFKILDALSATGLRALRYAKEIPIATSIVANDMSPQATESIDANVKLNKLEDKIEVTTGNAMGHMYNFSSQNVSKYDVIDLDPYGTAVPFLDAAMQAINDGGLLCVTCTDSGLYASCGYVEKTYALYGGLPIKGHYSHEGGLRLILHSIASAGAKYGIAVEPLLSLSIDFYARVFVRVARSQAEVKLLAGKTMFVYVCDSGCGAWKLQPLAQNKAQKAKDGTAFYKHGLAQGPSCSPLCEHCGMKMHLSGPMYGGPIHHPAFLRAILTSLPDLDKSTYATVERIRGMVSTALEETLLYDERASGKLERADENLPTRLVPRSDASIIDKSPFYFSPSVLAGVLHCQAPSEAALKGALKHAGYNVARSHAKPGTIKTNAPWSFIWEMMKTWEAERAPVKVESIRPRTAAWSLLRERLEQSGQLAEYERSPPKLETVNDEQGDAKVDKRHEIIFDEELGRDPNEKHLVRYQVNPRANWGPMTKARG